MKNWTITTAALVLTLSLTTVGVAGGKNSGGGKGFRGGNSFHGGGSFRGGNSFKIQSHGSHGQKFTSNHHFHNKGAHHAQFSHHRPHHPVKHHTPIQHQKFGTHQFHRHVNIAAPRFHHSHVKFHNYHLTHGKRFDYGYCYYGRQHTHWVSQVFSQDLGCTIYYCPCTSCWYYWCQPHGCYFPVSYCPTGTYAY